MTFSTFSLCHLEQVLIPRGGSVGGDGAEEGSAVRLFLRVLEEVFSMCTNK